MVDIAPSDSPDHFRFVLSNGPTAASKMCLKDGIIPNLASKVGGTGSADGNLSDTLRAEAE
eukprot:764814-Hanusia_phi.AAC.5